MKALIVGAGAQGRVALDILRAQGRHDSFAFIDDNPELQGLTVNGVPVECGLEAALDRAPEAAEMIVALGNPDLRVTLGRRIAARGVALGNAIHPSAVVMPTAVLGHGIVIGANAVVNSNARIADYAIVNTGAVVEHDGVLSEGVQVGPGAQVGGRVTLGESAFLGTGAIVLARVTVGARTVVGAGAVVTADLPARVLALGVPARVSRQLDVDFDWSRVL
ncbi:MAG: acetyltransferase [Acidobacteriia bacterium]|nr:acetyltransferase [Terriglobia bacterium]